MSIRPRRPVPLLLLASLALPACNGTDADTEAGTDGTAGTTASTGATTDSTTTATTGEPTTDSPTTTGPGPTSTSTADATSTTGEPTSTSDTGDTSSTTGAAGLACPLGDAAGVSQLALDPALFSAGADPSDSPACAIVNPERGFHGYVDLRGLDGDTLDGVAAAGRSLVYGQVLLPEYRESPLDAVVLDEVEAAFELLREHGMKVVPRFHYSDAIDEPDADLERILGHIEQLAPLLQQHGDVILTLQAGFIGAWGEWHASQNGLDAPGPRKMILDALLAALPADRTISVRRPSFKLDAYGGPLSESDAWDGSPLARVGHVNDCFLASDDDEGTYQEPGEKDYAIADSAFVPVGGETCAVNPPRSECPSALAELALHHWTHLNAAYHPDVLDGWQQDGCYAQIACRLGYRLAVTGLRWADVAAPGGVMPVSFELVNDGFAAPVNARPLVLVFDGPERIEVAADDFDLRTAMPGETLTICVDADLPADAPAGQYRIGLRLADPAPTLAADPRQAIRLGNDSGVEWSEGINWFDATFAVE